MHLVPCTSCLRHVRATAAQCPFCDVALGVASADPGAPPARLSRAARMAFGAAVATTLVACGNNKMPADSTNGTNKPEPSASASVAPTAEPTTTAKPLPTTTSTVPTAMPPYGAPPVDGLLV
ncbi:MAG: hypothetical protein IPJ34_28070 [Myxococcales bacterium]|nr:hypothetical protein [Myxococcales bacterium]